MAEPGETTPPSVAVTKIYSDDSNPNLLKAQFGYGVLVQCIDGSVQSDVALKDRRLGSTVSFVVGFNQAASWLDSAVANARQGDVLLVVDSSTDIVRTIVVRTVALKSVDMVGEAASRAEQHRIAGNKLLTDPEAKPKQWRNAIVHYNRALHWQSFNSDANQCIVSLRLNIALANLKLRNWERAATQCDAVLIRDPENTKALYRRARASFERQNFQYAISDLRKAKNLVPNDRAVMALLDQAINKQYADVQKKRQLFAEVYGNLLKGSIFEKQTVA